MRFAKRDAGVSDQKCREGAGKREGGAPEPTNSPDRKMSLPASIYMIKKQSTAGGSSRVLPMTNEYSKTA